jgi:hypothetical protein
VRSRAVYDGPFGCRVVHPGREARFFQGESNDREPLVASPSPIADLALSPQSTTNWPRR